MARVVLTDKCSNCRTCVSVCPAAAFHDCGDHVAINPDACIDCGACEMACPCSAIVEEDAPEAEAFVEVNAKESSENPAA